MRADRRDPGRPEPGVSELKLALSRVLDTALDRAVVPGFTKIGPAVRSRLPTWPADPAPAALTGGVAIVTGATSGLGTAAAEGLARLGAQVRLVVRDADKGEDYAEQLRERVPGADFRVEVCDASDLDDVRRFAAATDLERLDVLVHNAGAMPPERTESAQSHEMTMALHLLGPLLMTDLLRPALAAAPDGAQVILVTSGGMYGQALRADDPEYLQGGYSPTTAYARSKRAQVELLPTLVRRFSSDRIRVDATHPGWAGTPGLTSSMPTFGRITAPLLRDAESGADTTVWLAGTHADIPLDETGLLWHDRRPRSTHLMRRTRTADSERELMWEWALAQTGLSPS